MLNKLINGNAARIPLADGTVQCVVTSPPYWGLRQYLDDGHKYKAYEIGLEPTPELYVEHLVSVFREVRRVLRDDGTVWLNLGDSYASGEIGRHDSVQGRKIDGRPVTSKAGKRQQRKLRTGLAPKQLVGIPWRVAFALQADGWWLRSDVIWHKPNCMPESVTDRPTKAHEYLFLLTKRARYYYDKEAILEASSVNYESEEKYRQRVGNACYHNGNSDPKGGGFRGGGGFADSYNPAGRNRRTVWTIPTQSYKGAHFATFPEKLVEPCILAGTSARGECPICGLGWKRVVERKTEPHGKRPERNYPGNPQQGQGTLPVTQSTTTGWTPQCQCCRENGDALHPIPQTVFDPFAGTATVGKVAAQHRRKFVGLELNPDYISLATKRTRNVAVRLAL